MKRFNKTLRSNNRGVVFIAVMLLLALAGGMLLLMTKTSNMAGRQNKKMALDANLNNLQLSAMAWVKKNYPTINTNTTSDSQYDFTLEADNLNIKQATINGTATRIDNTHLKIQLTVQYQQAQNLCKKTVTYTYPTN